MEHESATLGTCRRPSPPARRACPAAVDRATFQAELDRLRVREKAHTRGRRRDRRGPAPPAHGRGRRQPRAGRAPRAAHPAGGVRRAPAAHRLLLHVVGRRTRRPSSARAAPGSPPRSDELSYLHSRGITYAVFCQGPHDRERPLPRLHGLGHALVLRPRPPSAALLAGLPGPPVPPGVLPARRRPGLRDLLDGPAAAPRRWTTATRSWTSPCTDARRPWEDSPPGWPQQCTYHAHRRRPARLATRASVAGRTPHRPVVRAWQPGALTTSPPAMTAVRDNRRGRAGGDAGAGRRVLGGLGLADDRDGPRRLFLRGTRRSTVSARDTASARSPARAAPSTTATPATPAARSSYGLLRRALTARPTAATNTTPSDTRTGGGHGEVGCRRGQRLCEDRVVSKRSRVCIAARRRRPAPPP